MGRNPGKVFSHAIPLKVNEKLFYRIMTYSYFSKLGGSMTQAVRLILNTFLDTVEKNLNDREKGVWRQIEANVDVIRALGAPKKGPYVKKTDRVYHTKKMRERGGI